MDNDAAGSINRDVKQPSVVSERMVLRPLLGKDARVVQRLARSHKVAQREGRRQNAERGAKPPNATPKPPQSLLIAKGLRPQSHPYTGNAEG